MPASAPATRPKKPAQQKKKRGVRRTRKHEKLADFTKLPGRRAGLITLCRRLGVANVTGDENKAVLTQKVQDALAERENEFEDTPAEGSTTGWIQGFWRLGHWLFGGAEAAAPARREREESTDAVESRDQLRTCTACGWSGDSVQECAACGEKDVCPECAVEPWECLYYGDASAGACWPASEKDQPQRWPPGLLCTGCDPHVVAADAEKTACNQKICSVCCAEGGTECDFDECACGAM